MKREQRSRNERWQLAVKIVCGAIASLLAGAFAASELFALSTRFSQALGSHYFYLYPPWAIATWWSKWHTNAPALFTQPLQLGGALAVILCLAYTIHVLTRWQSWRGVQRHPRQRALGEALGHQTSRLDQSRGSLRRGMEERLKDLHASPQWPGACPVLRAAAQRQRRRPGCADHAHLAA